VPEEDGWELLRALRAVEATRSVTINVCSVLNEPQLARMLGAAEYEKLVHKPGSASEAMRVQVWAHHVILLFIVLGNIGYFLSRRSKGGMGA
jgi:CheY-like chemotaxis protein